MQGPDVPIESVKRSYAIVDEVRERESVGVTELADALELPKSTVHNHLRTLSTLGFLVAEDGEYRVGTRYLDLGRASRNGRDVFRHGREAVDGLVEQANIRSQLVVEENGRGIVLLASQRDNGNPSPSARQVYPTLAALHTNAPGKAILARLSDNRVEEIIERYGLPARTERTLTAEDDLCEQLAAIRKRGYAIDRGEMIKGMVGIAAPIATERTVHGALAAYGPASEMRPALDGDLPGLVCEAAVDVRADIVFTTLE